MNDRGSSAIVPSLRRVLSQAAIEAVTDPASLAQFGEPSGMRFLRSDDVVAELRRIEGIGEGEARQLGRDAVAHVGGHVEPRVYRGGIAAGRIRRHHVEVWSVPRSAIRE